MNKTAIENIIKYSIEANPLKIAESFGEAIQDKIAEVVTAHRIDIAKSVFGGMNEDTLNEGAKLLATHTNGNKTSKHYHDREWEDHIVKYYTDGIHHKDADSHHYDDKEDAHNAAKNWVK